MSDSAVSSSSQTGSQRVAFEPSAFDVEQLATAVLFGSTETQKAVRLLLDRGIGSE